MTGRSLERVRPERRIMFERAEDMVSFMTPHRIRIYRELKETIALGERTWRRRSTGTGPL